MFDPHTTIHVDGSDVFGFAVKFVCVLLGYGLYDRRVNYQRLNYRLYTWCYRLYCHCRWLSYTLTLENTVINLRKYNND